MRTIALVIAIAVGLIASASAQKAEIEAVEAKWTELTKAISLGLRHSTLLMRPHSRPVLQWCRAERPLGQCGKAWRNSLAIRRSQPWTSSRSAPPLHARSEERRVG